MDKLHHDHATSRCHCGSTEGRAWQGTAGQQPGPHHSQLCERYTANANDVPIVAIDVSELLLVVTVRRLPNGMADVRTDGILDKPAAAQLLRQIADSYDAHAHIAEPSDDADLPEQACPDPATHAQHRWNGIAGDAAWYTCPGRTDDPADILEA